jgi:hypothetical protein
VLLGLCTQTDLNAAVEKARRAAARRGGGQAPEDEDAAEIDQPATGT